MCGDSFPAESVLLPLLDHSTRSDPSARTFTIDTHLPLEERNVRVCIHVGSYHNWLLSKWALNSYQGHILVYNALRKASWRHAKTAARLLVDAMGDGVEERRTMGRSILLVAVNEASAFFTNNEVNKLLTKGSELAKEIGCEFTMVSPSRNHSSQVQTYLDFFQKIYRNPLLPADYYSISPRRVFTAMADGSISSSHTFFDPYKSSTLTGSAKTLLSNCSTASREDKKGKCRSSECSAYSYASSLSNAGLSHNGSLKKGGGDGSSEQLSGSKSTTYSPPTGSKTGKIGCSSCNTAAASPYPLNTKLSALNRSFEGTQRGRRERPSSTILSLSVDATEDFESVDRRAAGDTASTSTSASSTKSQRRLDKIISSLIHLKSGDEGRQKARDRKSVV